MISEEAALAEQKRVVQRLVLPWLGIGVVLLVLADATIEKLFVLALVPWIGWIGFGVVVFAFAIYNAYSLSRLGRVGRGIATLSALPTAACLLAASVSGLIRIGERTICCGHPKDDALIRRFAAHRQEFERLVQMSDTDTRVIRIAPSFTRLKDDWSWPRPDSLLGFSSERWREYRRLFTALHLRAGLERGEGDLPGYLFGRLDPRHGDWRLGQGVCLFLQPRFLQRTPRWTAHLPICRATLLRTDTCQDRGISSTRGMTESTPLSAA
jgi:hypothetical protein